MRTGYDSGTPPPRIPDMFPSYESDWAPPRYDSTPTKDSLAEIGQNRVVRYQNQVCPLENIVWPVNIREFGTPIDSDTDSTAAS